MNQASNPPKPRRRRPPSDRDQALYREYSTSGKTQVQLGVEHGISQSRLSQIIRRVRSWLADTQPSETLTQSASEGSWANHQRQSLAQRLEYERLDRLYREAIRNFDRQEPIITTHREGTFGRTPFVERTVREVPPDVKWLQIALRAAEDILRLEHPNP